MILNIRSAGDSFTVGSAINDNDAVELEKSNILVMGPTGSGIRIAFSTLLNLLVLL